jgi:hypothetical protein
MTIRGFLKKDLKINFRLHVGLFDSWYLLPRFDTGRFLGGRWINFSWLKSQACFRYELVG